MKKINLKNLMLILSIVFSVFAANSQTGNPNWSLPPNFIPTSPFPGSAGAILNLPTQTSPGYQGQVEFLDKQNDNVQGPHNMYMDPSGTPLFSVVSGFVFSPRGFLIDTLIDTMTVTRGGYPAKKVRQVASGWAETCVVPVPGSCSQYFIFSAVDYGSTNNSTFTGCYESYPNAQIVSYKPCFAVVDIAQVNPNAPSGSGELGKIINPSGGSVTGRKVVDLFSSTSTGTAESGNSCSPYPGDIHYACTKLLNGSYRFLFVKSQDEIYTYKISSSGLVWVQSVDFSFFWPDMDQRSNDVLSEMEVYDDSTNSKIKLACTMASGYGHQIVLADFNRTTGNFNTGSQQKVCFSGCASGGPNNITGVEFSRNGAYVYITRVRTTADTGTVEQIKYSTATITKKLSGNTDFSYSQIELAKDTNMYLIGQNGLGVTPRFAKITSPSGTTPSLNDNVVSLSGHDASNPMCYSYPWGIGLGAYNVSNFYVHYLPDQIDQEIYAPQFSDASCCREYTVFDKNTYSTSIPQVGFSGGSSSVQVWKKNTTAGSFQFNPFTTTTSDSITIGQELRITSGFTVTIQNMKIKFTPHATLIVEGHNGSTAGAKLILKKCTLNVDSRCETNKLWPGVRVWGDSTQAHTGANQGTIIIDSSSVITNAWIGVELGYSQKNEGKYNTGPNPRPSDTTKAGGGILTVSGSSSFINNQRGVFANDYTRATTANYNTITASTFITNAALKGSVSPRYFFGATNYPNAASMKGVVFNNTYSSYNTIDTGIVTLNAGYFLDKNGTSTRTTFTNLFYGIFSRNTGGNTATVSSQYCTFLNNYFASYLGNINNAVFKLDSFKILVLTNIFGSHSNTTGLYLDNCTGYTVQDNAFLRGSSSLPTNNLYGCVASNSGQNVNYIFRNTFDYMYHGAHAQYRNYIYVSGSHHNDGGGLYYLCNTFTNNYGADIYVPDYSSSANTGPGLNCPSCTTQVAGIAYEQGTGDSHVYPVTSGNQYSHRGSGAYDFYIDSTANAYSSNHIWYCASSPSCTSSVYNPIIRKNVTNAPVSTNVDCSTAPGCGGGCRTSDEIQYLLDQADSYKTMYDDLYTQWMSVKKDSVVADSIHVKMGSVFSLRHLYLNEAIRELVRQDGDTSRILAYSVMKTRAMELPLEAQVETGIDIHDSAMAANALDQIKGQYGQTNYVKLHTILLQNLSKSPEQIMSNPSIVSQIQAMDADSSDRYTYLKANILLQVIGASNYVPYIEGGLHPDSTEVRGERHAQSLTILENNLYSHPNPFEGKTNIKAIVVTKTDNAYVMVTDMLGKEVGKYKLQQGENDINFSASDGSQQVFFCSLVIDGVKVKTNKMVMIK
ncbi:MAG: hypothetical protein ACXVNM_06315 [Bacteroidia bacterium]